MSLAIDPARSVVVVVDYQNDFCHERGAISTLGQDTSAARELLPSLRNVVATARALSVPRVFVRVEHSDWTDAPAWRARGGPTGILDVDRVPVAQRGSWGAELYELEAQPDELVLVKHRYSAFAYTALPLVLQAREATHVVLAGVQTNVCIHATARDAVQSGFVPVVVSDCVAAATPLEHDTALLDIRERMGPVVSFAELCAAWGVEAVADHL